MCKNVIAGGLKLMLVARRCSLADLAISTMIAEAYSVKGNPGNLTRMIVE